jgi:hypothetical protein
MEVLVYCTAVGVGGEVMFCGDARIGHALTA